MEASGLADMLRDMMTAEDAAYVVCAAIDEDESETFSYEEVDGAL